MSQIKAVVIAHSKSAVNGKEIITFELEFPRLILAEFNTHNALSKNASSSRAIPVAKMLEQVRNNPAMPVRFGKKNKGMQDAGEHGGYVELWNEYMEDYESYCAEDAWRQAAESAAEYAEQFDKAGYAKQICNRLVEPFQMMKVVMTATELNNFIWLRDHPAADPTIEALAKAINKAKKSSTPVILEPGDWHTPYFEKGFWKKDWVHAYSGDGWTKQYTLEDALAISASCCAQVSFRSLDDSIEKAYSVVEKLNLGGKDGEPVHASPLEHQATPIQETQYEDLSRKPAVNEMGDTDTWEKGITHMDRDETFCSGNLKDWIQHRQLIPNNVKRG